ncbi:MAG: hypothetical protein H6765_08430 [Candidatus Peribacteria bacterium]|nr:MAG: hypothetical protein H6765_08430 [Candidatus Peribacteria bacterium]
MDSIAKIPAEDTFSVIITIKPEGDRFNRKAQEYAEALYKKDEKILHK